MFEVGNAIKISKAPDQAQRGSSRTENLARRRGLATNEESSNLFDPWFSEPAKERLQEKLAACVSEWVRANYSNAQAHLEANPTLKSSGLVEGRPTPLVGQNTVIWLGTFLMLCRTLPNECWACVGRGEFVKAQHDKFLANWEEWNIANKHHAIVGSRPLP